MYAHWKPALKEIWFLVGCAVELKRFLFLFQNCLIPMIQKLGLVESMVVVVVNKIPPLKENFILL